MATVALLPQQDGHSTGWSSIVGADFAYQAVSDASDTSYLLLPKLAGGLGTISFPMFLLADGVTPISISITVRAKLDSGAAPTIKVGFNRGGSLAFDATMDTLTGSIVNYVHTFMMDPLSGGAWTESDLVGLEPCIQRESAVLGTARIIKVSGSMVYSQDRAWRGLQVKSAQLG